MDTPGFNDEKSDDETLRSILRGMQDKKIPNITTILWFVAYANRATTSLKRQARIIEAFAGDHSGNVWNNTIIVTKGDERGEGPRAAAEEIAKEIYEQKHGYKPDAGESLLKNTGNFEILLFESLNELRKKDYDAYTSEKLSERCIFKNSEPERIFARYNWLMEGHIYHPIVLKFKKLNA